MERFVETPALQKSWIFHQTKLSPKMRFNVPLVCMFITIIMFTQNKQSRTLQNHNYASNVNKETKNEVAPSEEQFIMYTESQTCDASTNADDEIYQRGRKQERYPSWYATPPERVQI